MAKKLISISLKDIKYNMKRNLMTLIGISLSVIFLVIVFYIGNIFKQNLKEDLKKQKDLCQISVYNIMNTNENRLQKINKMPGVVGIKLDILLDIYAIPNGNEELLTYSVGVYDDRFLFINETNYSHKIDNGCFVKSEYYTELNGLEYMELSVQTNDNNRKSVKLEEYYILTEEIEKTLSFMQEYDILIPVSVFEELDLNIIGYNMLVSVGSYNEVKKVAEDLYSFGYEVESHLVQIESITSQITMCNVVITFIGIVIFIIAFSMIFNYLMLYLEDSYQYYGMLKAIGIKNGNIFWLCLIRTILLCLIGSIIGGIISVIILMVASTFGFFKCTIADVVWIEFVSMIFVIFIGIIATIFPAGKVTKTDVMDLLEERR